MICKKNNHPVIAGKTLLFFFLLFSSTCINAQDKHMLADTLKEIIEVPLEEVTPEEAPPEEESQDGTTVEGEKVKYFLEKSQFEDSKDSLQLRKLPADRVKKLQEDDDFWYANALLKKEEPKEAARRVPLGQQRWFQTLLWIIIIGGFAGFLIWYLAGSNVGLFRKKRTIIDTMEEEAETEDIFAINYQKEIDKAAQQGNYRLAVRLMFLRLLKDLSEKNIIQYRQERTNLDYLLQLQPTRYYTDFFRITRNYEYSWYGHFDVNEAAYRIIINDFTNFERQLR